MSREMTASWALTIHNRALILLMNRDLTEKFRVEGAKPEYREAVRVSLSEDRSDWNIAGVALTSARTILLEPHIQKQLEPVRRALPEGQITCSEEMLWADDGFVLCQKPLSMIRFLDTYEEYATATKEFLIPMIGFSWTIRNLRGMMGNKPLPEAGENYLCITGYGPIPDQTGKLALPDHWFPCLHVKLRIGDLIYSQDPTYTQPAQEGYREEMWNLVQWVVTINTWLQQRLISVDTVRADRGYRKRVLRERPLLTHQEIQVVSMRRTEPLRTGEPRHRSIEWDWSWIVKAHKRHLADGRVIQVRAYVKNARSGKPLKPPTSTVYVARK